MKKETIERLTSYHIKRRKRLYDKNKGTMKYIKFHKVCHHLLLPCIKLLRILRRHKLVIVADKRIDKGKQVIYACAHIGGFDIENLFEAIVSPCYLFLADPREVYMNFDGLMLWLNGVICFESNNKDDRKIAKERAVNLLKSGGEFVDISGRCVEYI